MRENRTSGSMRRGERRSDGPLGGWTPTRKGGNRGAPPDLYATALAPHSTERAIPGRADGAAGAGGMGPPTTADFVPVTPGAVRTLGRCVVVARSGKGSERLSCVSSDL